MVQRWKLHFAGRFPLTGRTSGTGQRLSLDCHAADIVMDTLLGMKLVFYIESSSVDSSSRLQDTRRHSNLVCCGLWILAHAHFLYADVIAWVGQLFGIGIVRSELLNLHTRPSADGEW